MQAFADRIVTLTGGGYDRPTGDLDLPIDIQYSKLADWLVDRKQVPADWNRKLQTIQAKAAAALKELPPGFLGQFEGGDEVPLDYLRAEEILALLTETAEKSFLGSYKGAAGEWEKIVRAYKNNMLHVGEAALALARNADYEIPFLKKATARCQQQLADLERKQAESLKSASAAAADFQQECKVLGIDGSDIRGGLLGLTAELPSLVGEAVAALESEELGQAVGHYRVFAEHCAAESQAAVPGAADLLPTLQEVREGRTQPPATTAAAAAAASPEVPSAGGIDWGLGGGDDGAAAVCEEELGGSISWDLGEATAEGPGGGDGAALGGGISWDLGDLAAALESGGEEQPATEGEGAAAPVDISWDIDLTTAGEEAGEELLEQQPQQQAVAAGGAAAGVPAFGDAPAAVQRLIEDHVYRTKLLDDLLELQAFLKQRCLELSSKGIELLTSSVPESEQHLGADAVAAMGDAVSAAIATLTCQRLQQLLLLRTSARHLERRAQALTHKAGQEAKFNRAAREAEARRGDIQRQLMANSATLAVLSKRTRALKELVEQALGTKLGRRVNIMGEL